MADNTEAILLRLGLDASGFTKGARDSRKELGTLEKGVESLKDKLGELAVTAAAGVGLVELTRSALEFSESVIHVQQQTGLAIESIQYLRLAADLTGTSIDSLAGLVNKMQRQLVAASADAGLTQKFAEIGIHVEDLRRLKPEEQLQAMAQAIAAIPDPAQQAAAAVLAFGKSGAEALPELKALATQQAELQQAMERTGGTVSGETIQAVHGLGDAFAETKTALVAMATEMLGTAAPALRSFLETTTEVIGGLRLLGGQGDNALTNLDSKILDAEQTLRNMKGANEEAFTGAISATKEEIAVQEKLVATLHEQYQALVGLGQGGINAARAKRAQEALDIEKALTDGTLNEIQVRVQHEAEGLFQLEFAEQQHQERKLAIIGEANRKILDEDSAFRERMAEHAATGAIREQDVLHGGLTVLEQFQAESWDKQVTTVAGGLAKMTAGIAQHSRAAFEVNKAAAIVNTVVQTIQAVTKAWADYGWPYGAIMGAAIAAAGALQVSAIKSTSFNGGGQGLAPSQAATPATPTAQAGSNPAQGAGGTLRVEGLSADAVLSGASAEALAKKLLEFQKDGGQVVFAQ